MGRRQRQTGFRASGQGGRRGRGLMLALGALLLVLCCPSPVFSRGVGDVTSGSVEIAPAPIDALLEGGRVLYRAGRFSQAAEVWQQAAERAEREGDFLRAVQALNYGAAVEQELGHWEQAQIKVEKSLQFLEEYGNEGERAIALLAQALNNQGSLQLARGDAAAALATWQEAESLYARAGNATGEFGSQINQAQALQILGYYHQAEALLAAMAEKLHATQDSPLKAEALRSLGRALQAVGDLQQAEEMLEQSLKISVRANATAEIGATLLERGNLARSFQEDELALSDYREAAARAQSAIARLEAQINYFSLLVALEGLESAQKLLPQIEADLDSLEPSRFAVFARVNLAESLIKEGIREKTARLLAVAVTQAREIKDLRAEAYALTQLGRLYERQGQLQDAYRASVQATQMAQSIHGEDIVARSAGQLGRILNQQGNRQGAIAAYEQAMEALRSLRSDLATIDRNIQFDFKESVEPIYREFVSLLLQPPPGTEVSQADLRKARSAIEALQIAEIDNFFQEACFPVQSVEIDRIDSRAAVIYPIILNDRLETIISLPERPLQHYTTYLERKQLEATIQNLYSSFYLGYSSSERLRLSQQVYDWLIRPVENELASSAIQTLVFVLDGYLQNLPMAALHDGEKYLIERYSIALNPGLQQVFEGQKEGRRDTLAAGVTEARQGFPPLPAVEQELQALKAEAGATILLDGEFTRNRFQATMSERPFQIVHLATHGQFSSDPDETFVLAWDERINVKDFDRILRSRTRGTDTVELLVLSACRTAAGDRRAALGLAGFALRSGARSTIATLWSVEDRSAAALMEEFYRQWLSSKAGTTKAEALRQAQLKLLSDRDYQHPYFWAPFVLVGNWL